MERTGAFKPLEKTPEILPLRDSFQGCEICFCKLKILQAGSLVWSTYTVLDIEISAIGNQQSDHLVTIQSHSVVQGCISFLKKRSKQAKGGPAGRKWVPAGRPAWGVIPNQWEWSFRRRNSAGYSLGLWRWGPPRRRWDALRTHSGRSSPPRAALCWAAGRLKNKNAVDVRNGAVPDPKASRGLGAGSGHYAWALGGKRGAGEGNNRWERGWRRGRRRDRRRRTGKNKRRGRKERRKMRQGARRLEEEEYLIPGTDFCSFIQQQF